MSTITTILAAAAEQAGEHGGAAGEHGAAAGGEHAAEGHKSELPFFLLGSILVAFAIGISVFGFKRPDFPSEAGAMRGVMAVSVTLVLATLVSVIYVSA